MFKTQYLIFIFFSFAYVWYASYGNVKSQPYDESKNPVVDDVVTQVIPVPAASQNIDDHLIKLARAGRVSIIADVTHIRDNDPVEAFPATEMAQLNNWEPKFRLTLLDLTQAKKLSMLRYDANTFIFWDEPASDKITKHAKHIVGQPLLINENEYSSVVNLYRFLKDNKFIVPESLLPNKHIDIALHELTLPHQKHIQQIVQKLIVDKTLFPRAWFDEKFWQNAVMRIVPVKQKGHALEVAGFYQQQVVGTQLYGLQGD